MGESGFGECNDPDSALPLLLRNAADAFNFGSLLLSILNGARHWIGADGASAFLLDPADGQLKATSLADCTAPARLVTCHRVAEAATRAPEGWALEDGTRQTTEGSNVPAVLGVTVRILGAAAIVFCFELGRGRISDVTPSRLVGELRHPCVRNALRRSFIAEVHEHIRKAGVMPSEIRQRVWKLITELDNAFAQARRPPPEVLYVQLVDPTRRVIRTIQGRGFPLGFEEAPLHDLDSADIQADIARSGIPELIVGFDPIRFDREIFDEFNHRAYVRLWVPLFPMPISPSGFAVIPPARFTSMQPPAFDWKERVGIGEDGKEQMRSRQACWKDTDPRPTHVFGSVEIGYRRKSEDQLDFEVWNQNELATWCVLKVWELGQKLLSASLLGALDLIGHLSFDLAAASCGRFSARIWNGTTLTWTYPREYDWSQPVETRPLPSQSCNVTGSLDVASLEVEDGGTKEHEDLISDVLPALRQTTRRIVEEAAACAVGFFQQALEPFRLQDAAKPSRPFLGSESNDPGLQRVCRDACRDTGASHARYYTFDRVSKTDIIGPVGPPVSSLRDEGRRALDAAETEQVRKTARESQTHLDCSKPGSHVAFLPLDLADHSTGVLVLSFPGEQDFTAERMRELESRAPRWIQRLSLHRLTVLENFSAAMGRLRREVIAAKRQEAPKMGTRSDTAVADFLDRFLKQTLKETPTVQTTVASIHSTSETGPSHQELYVCHVDTEDSNHALRCDRHQLTSRELEGLCLDANKENRIITFGSSNRERYGKQVGIVVRAVEGNPRAKAAIEALATSEHTTTLVAIPLPVRQAPGVKTLATLLLFLEGEHHLRQVHTDLWIELGIHLGETLTVLLAEQREAARRRHLVRVECVCREMAKATTQDDIVGAIFRRLGPPSPETPRDECASFWRLADDALLWIPSTDHGEIVARSGRGKALAALEADWVHQQQDHPWFACAPLESIKKSELPADDWPILTAIYEQRCRLWSFDLEKEKSSLAAVLRKGTGHRWMMTFPLADAHGSVFGLVDMLRSSPFSPDEQTVLEDLLQRIALEFCSATQRTRYRRVRQFEQELHAETTDLLRGHKTEEARMLLVRKVKEHLGCLHCDLLLRAAPTGQGANRLHLAASTRLERTPSEQDDYFIEKPSRKRGQATDPLTALFRSRKPQWVYEAMKAECPPEFSNAMWRLLHEENRTGRLAIPLIEAGDLLGALHVSGLVVPTVLHRSSAFSNEHVIEAKEIGDALRPILRLLSLIREHNLQVNEIVHSLGQPLQTLRSQQNDLIRLIAKTTTHQSTLEGIVQDLQDEYQAVADVRDRLSIVSRLDQRSPELSHEPVHIDQELLSAVKSVAKRAPRGVQFLTDISPMAPARAERVCLRQALINLLENAAKYAYDRTEVRVNAREMGDVVRISIQNFGIGIPKKDLSDVFLPYFRCEVPDDHQRRLGTGLGLAIAREAVECVHRGRIWAESKPADPHAEPGDTAQELANIPYLTTFFVELSRGA